MRGNYQGLLQVSGKERSGDLPSSEVSALTHENSNGRYFLQIGNLFMSIGNLAEAKDMFRKGHERLKADGLVLLSDTATCLYKLTVVALREDYASKCEVTLDTAV